MDEAKTAVVLFKGFKDFGDKVSVITETGYYGFFKTKKDGTPTKALETLKELDPQRGDAIAVMYKETEANGKTYKNALAFYKSSEQPVRPEQPEVRNEVLAELVRRQDVLEMRIMELSKRIDELTPKEEEVLISDLPF